jgi:hypothetical protein
VAHRPAGEDCRRDGVSNCRRTASWMILPRRGFTE